MILIIDGSQRDQFSNIIDEMYQLRARVFQERLGWDVNVVDGRERDIFDDMACTYVVCLDAVGAVVGCTRLLQTTGPHMLSDVFYDILDGQPPLRSPLVWEVTRFCVDMARVTRNPRSKTSIAQVTSEVMIGALEYGKEAGVTDAIAVYDPMMERVMKRAASGPYDYIGTPKRFGKAVAIAGLLDVTQTRIDAIRSASGIHNNIRLQVSDEAELLAPFTLTREVA